MEPSAMSLAKWNWHPGARQLRQFAGIALAAFPLMAWGWGAGPRGWFLAAVGVGWALVGLVRPLAIRPLYWAVSALALPIGWVLGEVLLAGVYYGLFAPLGLIMRLAGRDPLQRRFDRQAPTYWQPKKQPAGPASYLRQT